MSATDYTILGTIALVVAIVAALSYAHVATESRRKARVEACQTCMEERPAGYCCVICSGCEGELKGGK